MYIQDMQTEQHASLCKLLLLTFKSCTAILLQHELVLVAPSSSAIYPLPLVPQNQRDKQYSHVLTGVVQCLMVHNMLCWQVVVLAESLLHYSPGHCTCIHVLTVVVYIVSWCT
jgi:hypothetical protein